MKKATEKKMNSMIIRCIVVCVLLLGVVESVGAVNFDSMRRFIKSEKEQQVSS